MRVLVIGGNRYFGKRLVAKLIEKNHEVTLLNRGNLKDPFGNKVKRILMDRKLLSREHSEIKNKSWDIIYDQVCYESTEAENACQTFADKTGQYVFISSQSVYSMGANLTEEDFDPYQYQPSQKVSSQGSYAEAKRQAEAVFFQEASFPVAAIRFPIVLGEDDYTGRLEFHMDHIKEQTPMFFPDINAKISLIHSEDAGSFLFQLSEKFVEGPINCSAERPIPLESLIQKIEEELNKKAILSENGSPSPFGIESDWYMNNKKLNDYGFFPTPILEFLPALIKM